MDQLNLLCKIGSYLPVNDICNYLLVKKGIDSPLFWRLVIAEQIPLAVVKKDYKTFFESYVTLKKNIKGSEHIWLTYYYNKSKNWGERCLKYTSRNVKYFCNITSDFCYCLRMNLDLKKVENICFPYLESLTLDRGCIKKITNLNLPSLTNLNVKNNEISVFENNNLPLLKYLNIKENLLKEIDLKPYPLLIDLTLSFNYLEILDISHNLRLKYVYVEYNHLRGIIIHNYPNLQLYYKGNKFLSF